MLRPGGRRFFQSRKRGLISFLLRLCWRARPKIRVRARSSILRIQHGPGFLHNQANFPSGRMKARAKSESAGGPPRFESFPRESGGVCSRSAARRKTGAECAKRTRGRTAKTCKFAHLLRPRAASPSTSAPRIAAATAGSGTCANPTCSAYPPSSSDSVHRNTATPFSIPMA